jgi:hypothetical protein
MKVGTDNPVKTGLAIALAAVAIFMLAHWAFGSHETPAAAHASIQAGKPSRVNSLDPTLRTDLLRDSEQTQYETKGRNIFVSQVEIPQPSVPIIQKEEEHGPPPPPPPPPINVKFFGFANKPGEPKKIFLSQGDDIWVASEGEVVNRRYKVLKINPSSVEIEDVLSNNRQSIPLTQS